MGFLGGASGKEPACQCRRHRIHGLDPWVGKIPWRGVLENLMDREAWRATVHRVTKSWTRLKQLDTTHSD